MNGEVKSRFIRIMGIPDVTAFVTEATMVEGDVEVRKGRWCVDGKSLLGMFSIDISQGATVVYPADATNFDEYVSQFAV